MRVVIALGGHALLRRGEPLAWDVTNVLHAVATAIAPIAREHDVIITHGNGPQIGLLALQAAAYQPAGCVPLDVSSWRARALWQSSGSVVIDQGDSLVSQIYCQSSQVPHTWERAATLQHVTMEIANQRGYALPAPDWS
jgi:hypothetical protein